MSYDNLELKKIYAEALKTGKQPNCPYCGKPLEVNSTQRVFIDWEWDKKLKKYVKDDSKGDADKPYCRACQTGDWDFAGQSEEATELGLDY